MKLWSKVLQIFLLFSLYFSSLNLKYLKLTKMDITRFAMKLFIYYIDIAFVEVKYNTWHPRGSYIFPERLYFPEVRSTEGKYCLEGKI